MALVTLATTIFSRYVCTSHGQRQDRIIPLAIVVVEILVAQAQAENPLRQQPLHAMLHPGRITIVGKALRKTSDQPASLIDLPEQQGTRIGGHASAVKLPYYLAPSQVRKMQGLPMTVCGHHLYIQTGA